MNHLTTGELHNYVKGLLSQAEYNECDPHIQNCKQCAERVRIFQLLESVLPTVPLESVSPDFTQKVTEKLKIQEHPSLAWKILQNFAPVFALAIVLVIVYVILDYLGVLQGSQMQQSVQYTQSIYGKIVDGVAMSIKILNEWLQTYFSFAFTKNSYGLTVFLVLFFSAIAVLDKFLFVPMMRRKAKV
jgi:hypothetical protein